ncbi:hypothetical protein ACQ86N_45060 [Puia sp. P3]|uniref:hypothetical protein n=1 Tax=Puia sp. P3 TaxID=3423952 RepID=UPI003D669200
MRLAVIILVLYLIPVATHAQHDVLVLQKRGMHVRSYTIGDPMTFRTIYDQWFTGVIDDLRRDTVYINGQAFDYKEIAAVKRDKPGGGWAPALIGVGVGYLAIGAFNGAYRHDAAKDWYTKTDFYCQRSPSRHRCDTDGLENEILRYGEEIPVIILADREEVEYIWNRKTSGWPITTQD